MSAPGGDIAAYANAASGGGGAGAGSFFSTSLGKNLIGTGIGLAGMGLKSALRGKLRSGVGDPIAELGTGIGSGVMFANPIIGGAIIGGSQLLGGAVDALFGSHINEANVAGLEQNNAALNQAANNLSTAQTNEDLLQKWGDLDMGFDFDQSYVGEDGLFASKAEDTYNRLKREQRGGRARATHGLMMASNNMANRMADQTAGNFIFGNGGFFNVPSYYKPKNILANGRSLEASFLDSFGADPIGAAVRYNRGLEALVAEREAREAEAVKAAEYADTQKRLLQLETSNQGLQALISAQSPTPTPEVPTSSPIPSAAAYNSNWDYIEDQLKRSGKFNDVQIKGIKYNLQRESSIGKYDGGDNGTARGLAQWRGERIPKDLSLEGQTKYLIDTLSNYDGKLHWIGRDNYEGFLNARTPEEAHYYIAKGYERPTSQILNKVKKDSDMSLKHINAFGGELGTNGTDFTNGLLYIDEGGTHEENPMEGVPMGLDPQGIPNLVEEGETVYNDYVFSDRMKVPFFMYKELGLGGVMKKKGKEMSFADASKKLAQESEQRPNDPISKAGLDASLAKLAEIQETERMRKQGKEFMGLEGYACGGKIGNKYDGTNPFGQKIQIGYKMPVFPDYAALAMAGALPVVDTDNSVESRTDNSSGHEYGKDVSTAGTTTDTVSSVPTSTEDPYRSSAPRGEETAENADTAQPGYTRAVDEDEKDESETLDTTGERRRPLDTWMRYAPAIGSGIMSLTDMLGLTNNPDYTYADKLEMVANRAGTAPQISYRPIGDYLTYRPMDIWYQQNALNAQSRATDRALLNSSNPSRMAGLLASGYNSQLASGNLYRQALEYNDNKRKDVADFNRRTNMFNSQMDLEAAMANARYTQAARQMGLSGLAQAAALRDSIDARVGASRSANLSNFLTSLGNIGRENFAMNQIDGSRAANNGYYTTASGDIKHDNSGKKKDKKKGGD